MSKRYLISTTKSVNRKAVESVLHDEMTETIYPVPLESFAANNFPEEVQIIPILEEGEVAVERVHLSCSFDYRSTAPGHSRFLLTRFL